MNSLGGQTHRVNLVDDIFFEQKIIQNNLYFLGQHIIRKILKSYTHSEK
jgi:hypothetical protein